MMKPTDEQLIELLGRVVLEFGDYDEITGELKPFQREVINAVSSAADLLEEGDRPTKPAAPEWDGEGLPPVGCICECLFNDGWSKVAVLAHHGDESWVKRPRKTHIVSKGMGNEFRPIRTKEQRERDELSKLVREAYLEGASEHVGGLVAITDAILSKYNLEPKQ